MSIGKKLCQCGGKMHRGNTRCGKCRDQAREVAPVAPAEEQVAADRQKRKAAADHAALKRLYDASLLTIERYEETLGAVAAMKDGLAPFRIEPSLPSGKSEATAVLVASDWHLEERVGAEVGDMNIYNLEVFRYRATRFFQKSLRLINLLKQDIAIPKVILALLGDFITGDIHGADNAETNELQPIHALVEAQNMLISGIEFLLANSDHEFLIPCHSGNHARTTQKTRFASENGHSLEFLLYTHLKAYFRNEPRITFLIAPGMHSYIQVYDQTIRFQHGHAIKYGGGVGGIFIPANKAIAQWSQARHADLDVFGHFHTMLDGGRFICNGSLIGYNSFALSIKASFERPRQALFLMDKKRGRTCTWPILVD